MGGGFKKTKNENKKRFSPQWVLILHSYPACLVQPQDKMSRSSLEVSPSSLDTTKLQGKC